MAEVPVKVALPRPLLEEDWTPMAASSVPKLSAKSCCSRARPPSSVPSRPLVDGALGERLGLDRAGG